MVLIASRTILENPNAAPEWSSTPNPVFAEGTSDTYDLKTVSSDPEGAALTYSLNAGSTALPSGVSLASNGIITSTSPATAGTTSGILVDVDDGVNPVVTSPSFSIEITSGAVPTQDVIFVHSEDNLTPTELSSGVPGLFTVSKNTNSHELDDPRKVYWDTVAASGNNPIYTGENYFDVYMEQFWESGENNNLGQIYRAERSGGGAEAMRIDMTSAGNSEWYAPEKYYYGIVFRIDRLDDFGVIDFPSPEGGGLLWQYHMRNWNPPEDYNPTVSLGHQLGGLYLRIEGSREPDGDNNGKLWYQIWDDTVAGTSGGSYLDGQILGLIFEIQWDSRTNADGGTGYIQVYKDGATTPTVTHGTPASPKSNLWPMPHLDLESTPRTPYMKYGIYRADYQWYTTSLPNGNAINVSYGNIVMHGSGANIEGVWESLNWDNRVGA